MDTKYEFKINELVSEISGMRSIDNYYGYMTQTELAKHTGLSQATIHRFMKSERDLKISEFLKLCDLVGKSPTDYFVRNFK